MELSESEKQNILEYWPFLAEMRLKSITQGGNNVTYYIHTPTKRFVLKIYSETVDVSQIEYEQALLSFLQGKNLSFAIPTPVPTSSGTTLVHLRNEQRLLKAVLLPYLFGQTANRRNLQHVYSIGS